MRRPTYRKIQSRMIWAGVCAALGAASLAPHMFTGARPATSLQIVIAGSWAVAIVLLVWVWFLARRLGRGIESARTSVLNLVADRRAQLPDAPARTPVEIEAMLGSLRMYQNEVTRERRAPDRRLVAVLAALRSGVVVITDEGQVSLLNAGAKQLLGAERARVGTSVFAALSRESVRHALEKAAKAGRAIETVFERLDGVELQGSVTPLADDEGAIIIFPPIELDRHLPEVDFDLDLHDVPPPPVELSLATPLDELPVVVMDTETTGLDAKTDRIVSLGAVTAHGTRLFRSRMIDDLVDPDIPIPPASTTVHGITDEMVADARQFPEVFADFERMAAGRVIIGHNICFDLTVLRSECWRHGQPWQDRVFIDTLRLASLLNPTLKKFELETLSELYQIDLHGRHTALGDALVSAELWFRMVPRLQQQGFRTLGDLLAFHCREAVDIIDVQRRAGWIIDQPERLRHGRT
ncbi:3'-5' exoribonuclease [bacterium]|nr:3'-5' exoribonuclease [bacterium]